MEFSNQASNPKPSRKPKQSKLPNQKSANGSNVADETEAVLANPDNSAEIPAQALARIEPATIETPEAAPAFAPPSFSADAGGNEPPQPYTPPPPIAPVEDVPLYLRDPGPPPRLPRKMDFTSNGQTSYRLREVRHGYINRRPLLWACAIIGLVVLYLLIVAKVQNRPAESQNSLEPTPIVTRALRPTTDPRLISNPLPSDEQFGMVFGQDGLILEEPRVGATTVEVLRPGSVVAFMRKSESGLGWYQLKNGTGWISLLSVKTFPTEDAALRAKRDYEAKITPK